MEELPGIDPVIASGDTQSQPQLTSHLCSRVVYDRSHPAPSRSSFFPPLSWPTFLPFLPVGLPGLGQREELEKRGGGPTGARKLPEETGRLLQGSVLNSQECVTKPEAGQAVPESLLASSLVLTRYLHYLLLFLSQPPRSAPKCLPFKTFLTAQETGLTCRFLISKCTINFLMSPFFFFSFSIIRGTLSPSLPVCPRVIINIFLFTL